MRDLPSEDGTAADPVARLLEESWDARALRASPRELGVELASAILFLAVAVPLAWSGFASGHVQPAQALLLVALYAIVSRTIKFPLGAGYVVPSYLVLVPMLLLLPPGTVPLLTAGAMVLGGGIRLVVHRANREDLLFSISDAWHAVGPALVLVVAGRVHGAEMAGVYVAAFLAGCVFDLVTSTMRESFASGVAPALQGRVVLVVWVVDACVAPVGLLVADAARVNQLRLLLLLPVMGLVALVDRDRSARISEARHRLSLVARERTRLQAAVQRLADAFAAKLDLRALVDVVLNGSIDALDADAGQMNVEAGNALSCAEVVGSPELQRLLEAASQTARIDRRPHQRERDGVWALALPLVFGGGEGTLAVARADRAFRPDEQALVAGLLERAQVAAENIVAHESLRRQAMTDPLTGLGNRRKLADRLTEQLHRASASSPFMLMVFDLDGFKSYNDTFGHVAGDALLARLGRKLAAAASPDGGAYRLGGDEFCVLLPALPENLEHAVAAAVAALEERGETFTISASCGCVLLPHEASTADYALQLADERMYARKHGRPSGAAEQAHDVLIHIMAAREPDLTEHSSGVAQMAVALGRRLGIGTDEIDELARAAALHDIGKVAIPEAILGKPGPLDASEWSFVHQHTLLGERILSAAPALRRVARIVRSSHERWDGTGYPDRLSGEAIPMAARIVAVCDAYDALTTDRCYRKASSPEFALTELRVSAGTQFDPRIVDAFIEEQAEGRIPMTRSSAAFNDQRALLVGEIVDHTLGLLRLEELVDEPTDSVDFVSAFEVPTPVR